jgi:hypothetical protein
MKHKGSNLNTLALTFLQVVNYELLQLTSPYVGACFRHAMNKTCQYVISNDKVCVGMTQMLLKNAQLALQKQITWVKKRGKGCQEWDKACRATRLALHKLKTFVKIRFASKFVLFQKTLEFANAINIFYQRQSLSL